MKDNGIAQSNTNEEILIIGDNVYVRTNIKDVSTTEQIGDDEIIVPLYEFEEKQYTKDEYLSLLHTENKELRETLDIILGVSDE